MQRNTRNRLLGSVFAGTLLALASVSAQAAQTDAGTDIQNTATVSYQVNGVDQTDIESSPNGNSTPGTGNGTATSFKVDKKLLLSVVTGDSQLITTQPGATKQVTTFTVTNDGNAAQSAWLTASKESNHTDPFGNESGQSQFDVDSFKIYADSNNNGSYDDGTDTLITHIASLDKAGGANDSATVFVVSTIPASATDGEFAVVGLAAQVGDDNGAAITSDDSSAAWDPDTVQQVFAEAASTHAAGSDTGAYDGIASDLSGYVIASAQLSIKKSSEVLSDPVSASGNAQPGYQPKAIPGAVVQYTITITNDANASQSATSIGVSDDLSNKPHLDTTDTGTSLQAYTDGGTTDTCGNAGVTCSFASDVVTVSGLSAAPGNTAKVTFTVKVK